MLMNRKTQYYTMSVVSKSIYRFSMNSMKIPPGILQSKLISILKCIYKVKGTKTVSSVQSLSHVRLFATPWTGTRQASLSTNNCRSLPKPMSTESVMPSNHLILCRPLLLLPSIFPTIRVFSKSQLFASGGQIIGASASATVLPVNIQGWFPLELTGLISLLVQYLEHNRCSVKYMSTWMN